MSISCSTQRSSTPRYGQNCLSLQSISGSRATSFPSTNPRQRRRNTLIFPFQSQGFGDNGRLGYVPFKGFSPKSLGDVVFHDDRNCPKDRRGRAFHWGRHLAHSSLKLRFPCADRQKHQKHGMNRFAALQRCQRIAGMQRVGRADGGRAAAGGRQNSRRVHRERAL
jgi:hypothetical protein